MSERFDTQLGRVRSMAYDTYEEPLTPNDREALVAILDQRARLRAALEMMTWNCLRKSRPYERKDIMATYLAAIHPQAPAEESE